MLQFATCESSRYSSSEQVRMVLDGGCKWIRLRGMYTREEVEKLMAPCEQAEAILVLDNNLELVDELRIHGLHLTDWTRGSVIAAREKLGPHAIIGASCQTTDQAMELKGLDIDYMVIDSPTDTNPLVFYAEFSKNLQDNGINIHPVASGNFPIVMLSSLLDVGMAGLELSSEILEAENPSDFVKLALSALRR